MTQLTKPKDTVVKEPVLVETKTGSTITEVDPLSYNIGSSDYSSKAIQPWQIWEEYNLNPWDADIVKRVLRTKAGEDPVLDYQKIIHICQYRIKQLNKIKTKTV